MSGKRVCLTSPVLLLMMYKRFAQLISKCFIFYYTPCCCCDQVSSPHVIDSTCCCCYEVSKKEEEHIYPKLDVYEEVGPCLILERAGKSQKESTDRDVLCCAPASALYKFSKEYFLHIYMYYIKESRSWSICNRRPGFARIKYICCRRICRNNSERINI